MKEVVIFVSNPFGFGPTGKIIGVMDALSRKWNGHIVYAASEQCQEPLGQEIRNKIEVITVNERDADSLKRIYDRYPGALVVVSLNKTATCTAKEMGCTVFFIDSLTWMWKEVPQEYLLADRYYYYDIFRARDKVVDVGHAIPITPIVGNLPKRNSRLGKILIHIGGFTNPFSKRLMSEYLSILWEALNTDALAEKQIVLAGGHAAIDFLSNKQREQSNSSVQLGTFEHSAFVQLLSESERFITTPGSTATFEAAAIGVPTTFLPPTNLSQWRQAKLLLENRGISPGATWEDILERSLDIEMLSEENAVARFSNIAETVYQDDELRSRALEAIRDLVIKPLWSEQGSQMDSGSVDGSEVIVSDILKLFASGGK